MVRYTVKQARNLRGLSQSQVAQMLGISRLTYRRYENNPEFMTLKMARSFSNVLDIPLDNIIFLIITLLLVDIIKFVNIYNRR